LIKTTDLKNIGSRISGRWCGKNRRQKCKQIRCGCCGKQNTIKVVITNRVPSAQHLKIA